MKIAIVAATPFEIHSLQNYLQQYFEPNSAGYFQKGNTEVHILVTGVGLVNTTYALTRFLALQKVDLVLNAGIAGALNDQLELGTVVQVISEQYADLGVEEANGSFTSIHELGLIDANTFPFQNGKLVNTAAESFSFLPTANGISVNKVHGFPPSIEQLKEKYTADIESMEGAAFFQVCLQEKVAFLEIRSISNYVEARNREQWNLPLSIDNLNQVLIEIMQLFTREELL